MSLSVDYDELRSRIGHFLGFGRTAWAGVPEKEGAVNDALKAGLRRFYLGEQVPGPNRRSAYNHDWSFLRPLRTLNTIEDQHTYDLPENFGGLDGPLAYHPDSSVLYPPVQVVSGHMVRLRRGDSDLTTRPTMAAIEVKDPDANVGTRYEITFWPTPDQEYALLYPMRIDPDNLEAKGKRFPLGGVIHSQTVIEACLAEAEAQMDEPGVHEAKYQKFLGASVSHDNKIKSVDTVGYNRNPRTADPESRLNWHYGQNALVIPTGYEALV